MLIYWTCDPDRILKVLKGKLIPLTVFHECDGKRYKILGVDGLEGALAWGVHLSVLRRWDFPFTLQLSISDEKINSVEKVKFSNVPSHVNLVYINVKGEWVEEGMFSPDEIKLVHPKTESDLKDLIERMVVHSADGCWFLTETLLPQDLKILYDPTHRRTVTEKIFPTVKEKFHQILTELTKLNCLVG